MRDLQLIALGMLMADRSLTVKPDWFGDETKQIADDLNRKQAGQHTVKWLANRGVELNGSVVDSVLDALRLQAENCSLLSAAFKVMEERRGSKEKA